MTITVAQFRADYPEFSSSADFPNSSIQYYLNLAYIMLNVGRWGRTLNVGAELFTAHNVALEARAAKEAANGGVPGAQTGPVNSKSVDKVSISYDTGSGIEQNAGHWNLTIYGTRFINLARMMGAGPIQIGSYASPSSGGQAWPGPIMTPGMTNFG